LPLEEKYLITDSDPDMTIKQVTFFLVDDDEDDQELFQIALEDANPEIRLVTAGNGSEALKMLERGEVVPDYIFLDLNMPLMDGKECLSQLKANPELSGIPVVIFSTSSDQRDKADTQRLGAIDFITKPPSISMLTTLLKDFIEEQIYKLK
jgi:CheY-like chemotaxis protein